MRDIGDWLVRINCVWYLLIAAGFLYQGNYPKVIYFFGAAILTVGVMLMK